MSDQKAKVKSYVRRRLESWQHEPNPHQIRADLANLRRGIGKALTLALLDALVDWQKVAARL